MRPSKKLDYKQYGPFKIVSPVGRQAYKLELPPTFHSVHPVFYVLLLEKCHADTIPGRTVEPPPPLFTDETGDCYIIEQVLNSRVRYGKLQYLL